MYTLAWISLCCVLTGIHGDVVLSGYTTNCLLSRGGHEYAGSLSTTLSGYTCQSWSVAEPHYQSYKDDPSTFPGGNLAASSNHCRNPDSSWQGGPWCYTTTSSKRWERCNITNCECTVTNNGAEYEGQASTTTSDLSCQSWASQTPHNHTFTHGNQFPDQLLRDASNYCRNPNGSRSGGPWCYTTSEATEWQYCNVPRCGFQLVTVPPPPTTPHSTTPITTTTTTTTTTMSTTASTIPSSTTTRVPTANTLAPIVAGTTTTGRPTTTTTRQPTTTTTRRPTTTTRRPTTTTKSPKTKPPNSGKPGRPAAASDGGSNVTLVASVVPTMLIVLIAVVVVIVLYKRGVIGGIQPVKKEKLEESFDNPSFNVEKSEVEINRQ